jgi:hypothetical protein
LLLLIYPTIRGGIQLTNKFKEHIEGEVREEKCEKEKAKNEARLGLAISHYKK